jgi:hypothetical protein
MLRTGHSHPPGSAPHLSMTHAGFATGDLGVSPDRTHTGWLTSACRSVTSQQPPCCHRAPELLDAPPERRLRDTEGVRVAATVSACVENSSSIGKQAQRGRSRTCRTSPAVLGAHRGRAAQQAAGEWPASRRRSGRSTRSVIAALAARRLVERRRSRRRAPPTGPGRGPYGWLWNWILAHAIRDEL